MEHIACLCNIKQKTLLMTTIICCECLPPRWSQTFSFAMFRKSNGDKSGHRTVAVCSFLTIFSTICFVVSTDFVQILHTYIKQSTSTQIKCRHYKEG